MNIVAKGVETADQLDFLRAEDCNEMQGFLVGRPFPIEKYADEVGRAAQPAPATRRRQGVPL